MRMSKNQHIDNMVTGYRNLRHDAKVGEKYI